MNLMHLDYEGQGFSFKDISQISTIEEDVKILMKSSTQEIEDFGYYFDFQDFKELIKKYCNIYIEGDSLFNLYLI